MKNIKTFESFNENDGGSDLNKQFSNMGYDDDNVLVGRCKVCGANGVDVHEHVNTCKGEKAVKESTTDPWLKKFLEFLDYPWQEDMEIEIVNMLSEYKADFKVNPASAAKRYLVDWTKNNRSLLDKVLGIKTSEKFATEFDELAKG